MLDLVEKHLAENGYSRAIDFDAKGVKTLYHKDIHGNKGHEIEKAVKVLINSFDILAAAREDARQLLQDASREKRAQYVSDLPGKALEYDTKYQEAIEYQHNRSVGTYMKKRIQYTQEKPSCIAKEWKERGQWAFDALSTISAIYDKALFDMQRERDYSKMRVIAKEAIKLIKGAG